MRSFLILAHFTVYLLNQYLDLIVKMGL